MTSPLFELDRLFRAIDADNMVSVRQAMEEFQRRLAASEVIRVFVDDTTGMGHQASTANVIRRLCTPASGAVPGYAYTGSVETYLWTRKPGTFPANMAKMVLLLPELVPVEGEPNTYRFGADGATVVFVEQLPDSQPPETTVALGFTGGADSDRKYPDLLNVNRFLRLQPYRWAFPNSIESRNGTAVDLERVDFLGNISFGQRAYARAVAEPQWREGQGQQADIVRYLTGDLLNKVDLCPVYSIRCPDYCELGCAGEVLTVTLASYLAYRKKPMIVVNLDAYEGDDSGYPQSTFDFVRRVLACQANFSSDRSTVRWVRRQLDFKQLDSPRRLKMISYDPGLADNLARITDLVDNWLLRDPGQDGLLYVQLGRSAARIAPVLFEHMMAKATLPPVFEGQNTTNLCLNIGNAYFQVNRPMVRWSGGTFLTYPSGMLSPNGSGPTAARIQRIADWLNLETKNWPLRGETPTTAIPGFITEYRDERAKGSGPYLDYFTGLRDFVRKPENDKLNMAVAYLGLLLAGSDSRALAGDTLAGLYDNFAAAAAQGSFVFVDQLDRTAHIARFVLSLQVEFKGTLSVDNATVTKHNGNGTSITEVLVTGIAAFGGTKSRIVARFTDVGGTVALDCRFVDAVDWRPDGLPWIGFASPFMGFVVTDTAGRVGGLLGGRVHCGNVDVDFTAAAPPALGSMVFTADLVGQVSIDSFYQLAGGVSLVSVLPLDPVTSLSVEHVEFGVTGTGDPLRFSVDYLFFRLGWRDPAGWGLLPGVALKELGIGVTVPRAGDAASVHGEMTGRFTVGGGVVDVTVTVPDLGYTGQLTGGQIELAGLLAMFLPGVTIDPPTAPAITQFNLNGARATGDFTLTCQLGFSWPIPSDSPIIRLEGIGLLVDRSSGVTTGSLTGLATLLPDDPETALRLVLQAAYLGAGKGWRFVGKAGASGGTLSLTHLMDKYLDGWAPPHDYAITGLGFTAEPTTGSYEISGRTAKPWQVPFIDSLTVAAALRLAYASTAKARYSGDLRATVKWNSVELVLACVFGEKYVYTVDWGALHAEVRQNDKKEWVATGSLRGVTLGGMIEDFVCYATGSRYGLAAPWNLLDTLSLGVVEITFNFTTKAVGFTVGIGPVNLGFCTIESVSVTYDASAPVRKVKVGLTGRFVWQQGDTLNWDATKPAETPVPPGGGSQLLDLRLLALGQHVKVTGDLGTVEKVINELRKLGPDDAPIAGPKGGVEYDPAYGWLAGTNFGLLQTKAAEDTEAAGYAIDLSVVFNDPGLYGLRLALAGPAAKVLAGLVFEVLYRRISDTIGVYQTELTLPDAMRTFDVGAFSVTLPVLGLSVYTNGDFLVDFGFPWNNDFSRSLSVSGVVPPGIPVLGSAGFYFGKLSGETTNKVPVARNGRFDPVIVFGFGIQVGIGKQVQYGVLKAGFSITVFGVIEGVLAKWNPNSGVSSGKAVQLQDNYYFALDGTFGIIGQLYGSVDFSVVKASVDVRIRAFAQISYIAYGNIPISVVASVEARASLEIDLGLFSITLHFSFSLTVKETFVIQNSGKAPWDLASDSRSARILCAHQRRLRATRGELAALLPVLTPHWSNLATATEPQPLTGYLVPSVTVSSDGAATHSDQTVCAVAMLVVESADPAVPRVEDTADTSFDLLARQIMRWVVAATLPTDKAPYSVTAVDDEVVSDDTLLGLVALLGDATTATPIPVDAINAFLAGQFRLNLSVPAGQGKADAAPFPMPPQLSFQMPAYGTAPALDYTFAGFNSTSDAYLASLREYFADLTVQVQSETPRAAVGSGNGLSVGSFVFADYFRLVAQQMCEAARDALRSYRYRLQAGENIESVVDWVAKAGATGFTRETLVEGNIDHPFVTGQAIVLSGAVIQAISGDTFTSLARSVGDLVTPRGLALANGDIRNVLRPTAVIMVPDHDPYVVAPDDTLDKVAAHFGTSLADLLDTAPGILAQQGLLVAPTVLVTPDLTYRTVEGDSPATVACRFGIPVAALAIEANDTVCFDPATALDLPHLNQLRLGALLADIAATNGLSRIGGMVGRYTLHGLRLPTDGITPPPAQPDRGLYALTGQQVSLPTLVQGKPLTFSLVRPTGLKWIDFGGGDRLAVVVDPADQNSLWPTVRALQSYLTSPDYRFAPPGTTVGIESPFEDQPTTFPTTTVTPWQSAGPLRLPIGPPPSGAQELRLWALPGTLTGLDNSQRYAPPTMKPTLGRYDEARGTLVDTPVGCYGWATKVGCTIKRLPGAPAYELQGVGEADIVLLERLLAAMDGSSDQVDRLSVLFPADTVAGAPVSLRSGATGSVTTGILQANLSTQTHPPAFGLRAGVARPDLLNTPYDFLRLLWECAITRSGGYYLYYDDAEQGGLPDYLFNDKGEAALTVLVIWGPRLADRCSSYVNTLATGEPFDTSAATVYARSVPGTVQVSTSDGSPSLDTLAYRYYTRPTAIAAANPSASLMTGVILRSERGDHLVTTAAPGGNPDAIATYFGTTTRKLKDANPQITSWDQNLPPGTALLLPTLTLTVGSGPVGTNLAAIAGRYGTTVAELAADNSAVAPLFATGQRLSVPTGPVTRVATMPPGCLGIEATRTPPVTPPAPTDPAFGRLYTQRQFTLLGYRLTDNGWFQKTNIGLPISYDTSVPAEAADRARTPAAVPATNAWRFHRVVPVAPNAKQVADGNPYAGIGGLAQVDLFWMDPFGNRVLGELGDPAPVNRMPMPVSYTDNLLDIGTLPGTGTGYRVLDGGSGPVLKLRLSFDGSGYSPPVDGTDTGWRARAKQAVLVYDRSWQQLGSRPEPTLTLVTDLLPDKDLGFDATRHAALIEWLFGDKGVRAFLAARAAGNEAWPVPGPLDVDFPFTQADVSPAQSIELAVSLRLSRPAALVDADFTDGPGVRFSETVVAPDQAAGTDMTHRLARFATDFEAALPGRKLTSGVDRREVGDAGGTTELWVLRIGPEGSGGFGFRIKDDAPLAYASRPLYNTLQSRVDVPYYDYRTKTGIDFGRPSGLRSFTGVDTDVWLRQFLAAVDAGFGPDLLVATTLVSRLATKPAPWDDRLRAVKESLAGSLAALVDPVFQDETPTPAQLAAAQEVFRQQLLIALSNNYGINAVMQVMAAVHANLDGSTNEPPRLSGTFLPGAGSDPGTAVSAATLTLRDGDTPLTFAVTTAGKGPDGSVVKSVPLDLTYRGTAVEHQIGELPGIKDYLASSWLAFVLPPVASDTRWPLDGALPHCEVPLPLRAFPDPPTMTDQQARTASDTEPVSWEKVLRWDYLVTYSERFHYPHDDLHFTAEFNRPTRMSLAAVADPVPDLAEFAWVYPKVRTDLLDVVATITGSSTQERIDAAAVVLESFVRLAERVATSLAAFAGNTGTPAVRAEGSWQGQEPWQTVINESSVTKDGIQALLVAARDAVPAGIDDPPVIDIPPFTAVPETRPGYRYAWCYQDEDRYLPASKGQTIPDRKVAMSGLNLLAAQNATTTVWTERNRNLVDGRTTADGFVYRTAEVAFPTPLRPTVTVTGSMPMAEMGSKTPVVRTLLGQWENLLTTLFASAPPSPLTIQVAATYGVALNPALPAVATPAVPVLFLPPVTCTAESVTELATTITNGIMAWFRATQPIRGGLLSFVFTVLTGSSGLDVPPMPLLILQRLDLPWSAWTDHPPVQA